MKPDLRTFDFPLEMRRRQAGWRLIALQAQLAQALEQHAALLQTRHSLLAQLQPQPAAAQTAVNLVARRFQLGQLTHLRNACQALQRRIDAAEARVATHRQDLGDCQRELDALDRCRDDSLAAHQADQQRRDAVLADQQWLARRREAVANGMRAKGGST